MSQRVLTPFPRLCWDVCTRGCTPALLVSVYAVDCIHVHVCAMYDTARVVTQAGLREPGSLQTAIPMTR